MEDGRFVNRPYGPEQRADVGIGPYGTGMGRIATGPRPSQ